MTDKSKKTEPTTDQVQPETAALDAPPEVFRIAMTKPFKHYRAGAVLKLTQEELGAIGFPPDSYRRLAN